MAGRQAIKVYLTGDIRLTLTADTRLQKLFMIVGPRRSGKGTIARVMTALLGNANVVAPTLSGIGGDFGMEPLIDKRAAIIADARIGARSNTHLIVERLLNTSGEDVQTINRKNIRHSTGKLGVRVVIMTNELPRVLDQSGAFASLFVILILRESVLGREDPELTDKLLASLPSILNWALHGLDRLRKRGRFLSPKSSLQAVQRMEDLSSPVSAFMREWCVVDKKAERNVKELFDAWGRWCEQQDIPSQSSMMFGKNLNAAIPYLETKGHGDRRRYCGVDLSEEGEAYYKRMCDTPESRKRGRR